MNVVYLECTNIDGYWVFIITYTLRNCTFEFCVQKIKNDSLCVALHCIYIYI